MHLCCFKGDALMNAWSVRGGLFPIMNIENVIVTCIDLKSLSPDSL